MASKTSPSQNRIPWQGANVWSEVLLSVRHICESLGERKAHIRAIAQQIRLGYLALDGEMEKLCDETCANCREICCLQATVWYDLRDMLFLQLSSGTLPLQQISRKPDRSCANLGPEGCRVPRSERPFICTWYICRNQKEVLSVLSDGEPAGNIHARIVEMQEARKLLEKECIEAVRGR